MAKLIKLETIDLPKVYVVGKEIKVNMEEMMKGNSPIGEFWEKCMNDDTFETLQKQNVYSNDYVGFMTDWDKGDGNFIYSCGMLLLDSIAPTDEYTVREIAPTKIGLSWIQGKDITDVCVNAHDMTIEALKENGQAIGNMSWSMEVYNSPRFTNPDENGNIILDYYVPLVS